MTTRTRFAALRPMLLGALALGPLSTHAVAQGPGWYEPTVPDCTVLELPAIVDEPGLYCLDRDWDLEMTTGGRAIVVASDDVVLDFRGHLVRNRPGLDGASLPGYPIGVLAIGHANVVVRDGALAGFRDGIVLSEPDGPSLSRNHLVEGMRIYDCRRNGIAVRGGHSVVRNNVVSDIVADGYTGTPDAQGIWIHGNANRVIGNEVSRVIGPATLRRGIAFVGGTDHLAIGNRLTSTGDGLSMFGTGTVYRENFVLQISAGAVAFDGGIDAGGNFAN